MIFCGVFNGIQANILYDQGSGTQIMSKGFAEANNIATRKLDPPYRLRYGNNNTSLTDKETIEGTIGIGNVRFKETFFVNPHNLPGIDLILGKSFMDRVKSETRYPEGNGLIRKSYVRFPSGECIYTRDNLLGGTEIDIQYIDSGEAYNFLRKEQKLNGDLGDIEFYKISVQK